MKRAKRLIKIFELAEIIREKTGVKLFFKDETREEEQGG